jgi:hypothetical protein
MRCPKCQAEVANELKTCPVCGKSIPPGVRRRAARQLADPNQIKDEELGSRPARIAYQCALYGLIPLAGLILGPLALGFGCAALRVEMAKVGGGRAWTAIALMFIGTLILVGNWAGVAMMVYGLATGQ